MSCQNIEHTRERLNKRIQNMVPNAPQGLDEAKKFIDVIIEDIYDVRRETNNSQRNMRQLIRLQWLRRDIDDFLEFEKE